MFALHRLLARNRLWQVAARRIESHRTLARAFTWAEDRVKAPAFGCRMCGQCALPSTAYTCPMTCPKQLRNGPCGGVSPEGACEVYPELRCVWVVASERAEQTGHVADLRRLQRPIDQRKWGSSSWLNYWLGRDEMLWTSIEPPRSATTAPIRRAARLLAPWVDAANVDDNPSATARMASWAGSLAVMQEGVEPVMQLQCRDRNRIALQSDLIGAAALGIANVAVMTGDQQRFGDHPEAKGVFDLDSTQLIWAARTLRDQGQLLSGRELKTAPRWLIGAVENPFAPPQRYRAARLGKKVAAAAQIDQLVLEFARKGYDDLALFTRYPAHFTLGLGVIDVKSQEIESPDLVASRVRRALQVLPADRIVVNPDWGLRHLPPDVARAKLRAMSAGAALARKEVAGG